MQHLAKPFSASAKYLSTFHSKHHNSTHFQIDGILKAKSLGVFPRPGKTAATRLISMLCIFAATSIPDALLEMQTIALLMSCKPLSRNKRGTRANCFDLADLILPFLSLSFPSITSSYNTSSCDCSQQCLPKLYHK